MFLLIYSLKSLGPRLDIVVVYIRTATTNYILYTLYIYYIYQHAGLLWTPEAFPGPNLYVFPGKDYISP